MSTPDLILTVDGLKVAYGSHWALRGVQLGVVRHEILAVIGPAQSGKTTLLVAKLDRLSRSLRHVAGPDC